MALTYEAAGSTVFNVSAVTTFSFTPDASTLAGDVFQVLVYTHEQDNANIVTPPTGTVEVAAQSVPMFDSTNRRATVFYWVAPTDNPGTVNFSVLSTRGAVNWLRFRGVDTADPLDDFDTAVQGGATSITVPALTTTVANTYVSGGFCTSGGGSISDMNAPAGWTERVQTSGRLTHQATKGVQASTGSSGTAQFTITGTAAPLFAFQSALRPAPEAADPALTYAVVGAPTASGFTVRTKTTDAESVRVKVGTNTAVTTGVTYGSAGTPDSAGWSESVVTGLNPATQYYFMVELTDADEATTLTALAGSARTLPTPGAAAGHTLVFGSCAKRQAAGELTGVAAYQRMADVDADLFFHLGDNGYPDNSSTSQASHRADMEGELAYYSGLRNLVSTTPTVYVKSDHDSGGGNDALPGSYTAPNRAATLQIFPYNTRPDSDGLYHSFVVGRIRYIFLDTRYFADDSPATKLGATQKAWLFDRLTDPEPVKILVTDGTWNDNLTPTPGSDKWNSLAPDEREEIGEFVETDAVGRVVLIHGDMHSLAADDGSHNLWGGFPTFCAAPLWNTTSHKTENGPDDWSEGQWPLTPGDPASQFAKMVATDDGAEITLSFTGYDTSDVARVTLEVVADVPQAATFSTETGAATAAGGTGALAASAEISTTSGSAAAAGGSSTFSASAVLATGAGSATAGGGSSTLTGAAAISTAAGDAAAAGGTGTITADAILSTGAAAASAAGGSSTFTAGAVATISTMAGTATAAGAIGSLTASAELATSAGGGAAEGGVSVFTAGAGATIVTLAGSVVAGGGAGAFTATAALVTTVGAAVAAGGVSAFDVGTTFPTLEGGAVAGGGLSAYLAGAVVQTQSGPTVASGGQGTFIAGTLPPIPSRPQLYPVTRRTVAQSTRRTLEGVS